MGKIFYSKDAKKHFWRNLIFFVLILAALIYNCVVQDNEVPENVDTIVTEQPLKIGVRFDGDSVFVTQKAGTELKILGVRPAESDDPQKLWVEAPDGTRGWVEDANLGVPMVARNKKSERLDTVRIVGRKTFGYLCRFADGTEDEVDFDMVSPVMSKGQNAKQFFKSATFKRAYMTADKFETQFLGATFEENDLKSHPAIDVVVYKDSVRAKYPIKVLDIEAGVNYMPVVTYNNDGKAVTVARAHVDDRSAGVLALLPLAGMIIDCDILANLINDSFFDPYPIDENNASFTDYLFVGLYIIGGLIWLYITQALIVHLFGWLMHFRFVFYPLNDTVLKLIIIIIGLACTYVWFVLMLAWGMIWFVALPMFVCSYIAISHAIDPLKNSFPPCDRCPGCRRIHTMQYYDENYLGNYETSERRTDSKVIGTAEKRWETWTEVTKTDGYGHTNKENINYKSHKSTLTTRKHDHYDIDYNVKVYKDIYRCSECGRIVGYNRYDYNETGRKYLGSDTTTTETQNY